MIGKELLSERYITISHAKTIMTGKANVDELSYEHGCALDYLEKFAKLSPEDAEKLIEDLKGLGLDEKTAVKIADMLPEDVDELSYEHGCALDYLEKFAKLSPEDTEKLIEDLKGLGLDEKTAVKIADMLPEDAEDLKLIFYKSDIPKNSEEILDIISQYR
jgi:DNA-directed RNA polymerase subunit F